MLAENGYTADVAAQRLHDALNKVVEDAHTRKKDTAVAPQSDHRDTADFEAQMLHNALKKFVEGAHTKGPAIALQADLPSIVVPTIGLSLETIAADIRTFFPSLAARIFRGSSQLHKSCFGCACG